MTFGSQAEGTKDTSLNYLPSSFSSPILLFFIKTFLCGLVFLKHVFNFFAFFRRLHSGVGKQPHPSGLGEPYRQALPGRAQLPPRHLGPRHHCPVLHEDAEAFGGVRGLQLAPHVGGSRFQERPGEKLLVGNTMSQ